MKTRRTIFVGVLTLIFGMAFVFATASMAKNDKSNSKNKSEKSSSKSEKVKELKNFEKPTNQKSNAAIHKEKIIEVTTELKGAAEKEKNKGQQKKEENANENQVGNPDLGEQVKVKKKSREEIAQEIEVIADEADETEDETTEAIETVEKQGGFKKFLVGSDYKNLGQLRSSLVHNRNQIRKLTRLVDATTDEETKEAIQEQLTTMMQERERIKTVIEDNEGGFSVLGWVFKLMNGYPDDSINDDEEEALEDEVEEVLGDEYDEYDEYSEDGETEDDDEDETGEEDEEEEDTETEETPEETTL